MDDSPIVARSYCPGCEPDADPFTEILEVRYCESHAPARSGSDDIRVGEGNYMSGGAEAGGETNRRWCEAIHGPARKRRRRKR